MPSRHDLAEFAREQGGPLVKFGKLKGDFWPEGRSVEAARASIEGTPAGRHR